LPREQLPPSSRSNYPHPHSIDKIDEALKAAQGRTIDPDRGKNGAVGNCIAPI
jgi:hypothetical protein